MSKDDLIDLIVRMVREMSEDDGLSVPDTLDAKTALFGDQGFLDSLSLVSLIIAVEQAIEEEKRTHVSLADEKALSMKVSPYRTIGTLADFAASALTAEL